MRTNLQIMFSILQSKRIWVSAKDLIEQVTSDPDWLGGKSQARRMLRLSKEESMGEIISGPKGYKLTMFATDDERKHYTRRLRSQARTMVSQAELIELKYKFNTLLPAAKMDPILESFNVFHV
jgi:hypothetical protein